MMLFKLLVIILSTLGLGALAVALLARSERFLDWLDDKVLTIDMEMH